MRLWKVNSFEELVELCTWRHFDAIIGGVIDRRLLRINRNGFRLLSPPQSISFALCSAHAGAEIYSSSPSSTTSSSSSFSTASLPDSSCLFVPNSVIIKQSFIVRVCVVINDCFYAKEIRITESESEIRDRIRNSGCSFGTMTDTRGQWKRMTEWDTSRIWKAKSISMLIGNRRGGKGR